MRSLVWKLTFCAGLVGVALTTCLACSDWPGVDKSGNQGGNGTPQGGNAVGTCSGTPLACNSLSGADCSVSSGCRDMGSCTGSPTVPGEACGAQPSYMACAGIGGCFWSPNCQGSTGACTGLTQASCLAVKGCSFVPAGSTSNPVGTTCSTYGATCTSNASCDCGFSCVPSCITCGLVCGHPCSQDFDCIGAVGPNGTLTAYCTGSTPTTSGICSVMR